MAPLLPFGQRAPAGSPISRGLPDGRWLDLVALPGGEAKLIVAANVFAERPEAVYRYRSLIDAEEAFKAWAGVGEPMGWYLREPDDR